MWSPLFRTQIVVFCCDSHEFLRFHRAGQVSHTFNAARKNRWISFDIAVFVFIQVDDTNELFCRVCNQFFSSMHNKKEHLFGKQHLLMLTEEFEREAEQNANGTEKSLNDSSDLAVADAVQVDHGSALLLNKNESVMSITQFTEKFLEQNLSEFNHVCYSA